MSGFAVEPGRRTVSECLRAAKSPVWHARPARMPYSQEAAEHDLGVSLRPFSGNEAEVRRDVPNRRFLLHLDKRNRAEAERESTFHDNVSLVNRAENGSQIARSGKTPDEIPRDAEQDKRTGSAPHPSPVVLSECGKSKDSDSDGRNSQRKH